MIIKKHMFHFLLILIFTISTASAQLILPEDSALVKTFNFKKSSETGWKYIAVTRGGGLFPVGYNISALYTNGPTASFAIKRCGILKFFELGVEYNYYQAPANNYTADLTGMTLYGIICLDISKMLFDSENLHLGLEWDTGVHREEATETDTFLGISPGIYCDITLWKRIGLSTKLQYVRMQSRISTNEYPDLLSSLHDWIGASAGLMFSFGK